MGWAVEFYEEFKMEYDQFDAKVKEELVAQALALSNVGPHFGRPYVDTLKGSRHANMKELRFDVGNEVWRVAFAFDPERKAILLAGADKRGKDQKRFYSKLINIADTRYSDHLVKLKKKEDYGNPTSKSTRRISKGQAGKNKGKGR